jgi:hypothetical protein
MEIETYEFIDSPKPKTHKHMQTRRQQIIRREHINTANIGHGDSNCGDRGDSSDDNSGDNSATVVKVVAVATSSHADSAGGDEGRVLSGDVTVVCLFENSSMLKLFGETYRNRINSKSQNSSGQMIIERFGSDDSILACQSLILESRIQPPF